MANNTITFDPAAGVSYSANLTINTGANFKSTFKVIKPETECFLKNKESIIWNKR